MFRPCMPRSTLHFRSLGLAVFAQKPGLDSRPCPGEQPPPHWNTQDRYQIETRRSLQQYIDYFPVTVQTCRGGMNYDFGFRISNFGFPLRPRLPEEVFRVVGRHSEFRIPNSEFAAEPFAFNPGRLFLFSRNKLHSALDWNVNGAFGFTDPPIAVEKFELIGIELL